MLLVCVSVCMFMCVYLHSSWRLHLFRSVGMPENRSTILCFLSCAKFFHRYFRMKHETFLTSCFLLFTCSKRAKAWLGYCTSCFQNIRLSSTITRHRPCSDCKLIYLWRLHLRQGSPSNYLTIKTSTINLVLGIWYSN